MRVLLDGSGSPLYASTWKTWDMPSGPPICALRASARRTSGNGSTGEGGWPTPLVPSGGRKEDFGKLTRRGDTYYRENGAKVTLQLDDVARMTGWVTPKPSDGSGGGQEKRALAKDRGNLNDQVMTAGWGTPTAEDHRRGVKPPRPHDSGVPLSQQAAQTGWPTPVANDDNKSPEAHLAMKERMGGGRKAITSLSVLAKAGWATPNATEISPPDGSDSPARAAMKRNYTNLGRMVHRSDGKTPPSSSARTAKRGRSLNPAFCRWLMGFPAAWDESAPTATPSSRKSRRRS